MNKKLISLAIIVALLLVAIITCPDKQKHKDALMNEFNSAISTTIGQKSGLGNSDFEQGLSIMGSTLASSLIGNVFDSALNVHNYMVFSVGEITINGNSKNVSFGVLGHVFTSINAEDIENTLTK